jgi:8-oxo-dGTP pyrophosphatase MutT (NUDIX family)
MRKKNQIEARAGGIVAHRENGIVKYLLVTSLSNPDRWIIPAGHVEEGEKSETAALREVAEEAGVKAEIIHDLGSFEYFWDRGGWKQQIVTKIYLMRFLEALAGESPEGRRLEFYRFEEIMKLNIWEETRRFFEKADRAARELLPNK